jgi:hypothetical protein
MNKDRCLCNLAGHMPARDHGVWICTQCKEILPYLTTESACAYDSEGRPMIHGRSRRELKLRGHDGA